MNAEQIYECLEYVLGHGVFTIFGMYYGGSVGMSYDIINHNLSNTNPI